MPSIFTRCQSHLSRPEDVRVRRWSLLARGAFPGPLVLLTKRCAKHGFHASWWGEGKQLDVSARVDGKGKKVACFSGGKTQLPEKLILLHSYVPARHSRLPCRLLSSSTPCGVTTTKAGQESERYHEVRRRYTARETRTRLTDHVVSLRAARVARNRIDFFRCPSFRRNNTTTTAHLRFRQLERVGRHLHLLDALLQLLHVPSPPTPTSRWSQNSRRERTLTTVALD